MTIASDLATHTVNYVARALGLPCNDERCTECSTNKYRMRKALKEAGLETPEFVLLETPESALGLENLAFPFIIKPTDRSGRRGIAKVHTQSARRKRRHGRRSDIHLKRKRLRRI